MILGIDVGGTHTDAVLIDRSGVVKKTKVPTDDGNLLSSLHAVTSELADWVMTGRIERVVLSSTLSTNAIVQNKVDRVGMMLISGPGLPPSALNIPPDSHFLSGCVNHRGVQVLDVDPTEAAEVCARFRAEAIGPEREERLLYTQDQVFEEGLLDFPNILEFKPRVATAADVAHAHICVPDVATVTTESHLISAGGAIAAADKVLSGTVDNAFALVRPPGHHAMLVVHGARGFCNVNSEAIMIEHIRKHYGPKWIAVVDTDCHHGDGTQDNHYTDPITNMRISAQGYALLNERLAPQIAVLEGGYSIEAALPYVNVGIILTMAGLDYSHVREPDYDPAALRQSAETTRAIEEVSDGVLNLWRNRRSLKKKRVGQARALKRKKFIHYDTDGISERQEETVRICDDCGGMVAVDSAAHTGNRIFAVILPGRCCPACRGDGERLFEGTGRSRYDQIYLQDRERDLYLEK